MAVITIEDKGRIVWDNVPRDVAGAIETLLYKIEENLEIDMVSHVSDKEQIND